jgi:eps10P
MSSSDILLLPTQAECAGIVFVEASAYSMPIFTYDTGGISNYVINGINGYRLPLKSDSYEFASKIENCIKSGELSLMQEYAANLYKEKLNWAHWSKRFKKIIDNI